VHFKILDDMLHRHEFLLTQAPSLADFAVFGAIYPLVYSGNQVQGEFKRLQAWYEAIDRI